MSGEGRTAMPKIRIELFALALLLGSAMLCVPTPAGRALASPAPASGIPAADLIQPAEFAAALQAGASKPVVLQVGFRTLYDQAHISGAEYAGAAGEESGLHALRERVAKLQKDTAIVIYCGCCPWSRCPNIAAAFAALHALGFTRVKALYIADNFGSDWVDKGYPVDKAHPGSANAGS
jgi:rhodanese-related sulfurtransferase